MLELAESTGTTTDLRNINFRDKKMIVVEDMKRNVSTIVISDSDSYILQLAVKHFNEDFCCEFGDIIDSFDGSISLFDEATSIVRRVFPFVPPEEIMNIIFVHFLLGLYRKIGLDLQSIIAQDARRAR